MIREITRTIFFLALAASLSCTRAYLGGNVSKLTGVRHEFRPGVQLGIGGEIAGSHAFCGESMFMVRNNRITMRRRSVIDPSLYSGDPPEIRDFDLTVSPVYWEYAVLLKRQFHPGESVKLGIMAGPGIYLATSGGSKAVPKSEVRTLLPTAGFESGDFISSDEIGWLSPPDAGYSLNAGIDYSQGNRGVRLIYTVHTEEVNWFEFNVQGEKYNKRIDFSGHHLHTFSIDLYYQFW